jgi:outer membrane protein OmpA-like peptidoglycan-associated protein
MPTMNNTPTLGMTPESLRAYDRRHGLLALLLLAALVLLPMVAGIGPHSWRDAAARPDAAMPAPAPAPVAASAPATAMVTTASASAADTATAAAPVAAATPVPAASLPSASEMVTPALAAAAGATPAPSPAAASAAATANVAAAAPATGDKPAAVLRSRLTFANARHQLPPNADRVLVPVAARMKADPTWKVALTGFHSKGQKSAAFNQALARKRAEEVAARLRALGVPADRIEVIEPVQTVGSGPDSEARRVEIDIRP